MPQANLSIFKKGAYYSGTKTFSSLSTEIKDFSNNPKKFKIALKHFLYSHSFYTLDEYFNRQYVDKQYSMFFYRVISTSMTRE